jgi:capsular polysaccharide biosynthesis protein
MELMAILRVLRRRWWLVLLPVVVAGVIAGRSLLSGRGGGGYATSFRYTAMQVMDLPQRDGDYQDVWLASEFVVNAFTEWIRSSSFRAELQTLLPDLDLGPLGISGDKARSVGVVALSYPDEKGLQQIADAAVTVLETRSGAYFPQLGEDAAQFALLDTPVISAAPPALPNRFGPLLQIGVALIGGLALAFLVEYLDTRIRSRTELESQGWTVLGRIP